LGNITQ